MNEGGDELSWFIVPKALNKFINMVKVWYEELVLARSQGLLVLPSYRSKVIQEEKKIPPPR